MLMLAQGRGRWAVSQKPKLIPGREKLLQLAEDSSSFCNNYSELEQNNLLVLVARFTVA